MATVTCHTDGCANQSIPIQMNLTTVDESGQAVQIGLVICGVCDKRITDIKR